MSRKRLFLTVIILGLFIVVAVVVSDRIRLYYEATASLRILSVKPGFFDRGQQQIRYNEFVNTQIVLMRSPAVLDKVLETPDIARLPMVLKQRDRRTWLTKKLRIERQGNSEIVTVSIVTNVEDASEKIVNAVVDTYLTFVQDTARYQELHTIANLQSEKRSLISHAQQLQESIRNKTVEASRRSKSKTGGIVTGLEHTESLRREIVVADVALTIMKAERKAIFERMEQLTATSPSILVQFAPEAVSEVIVLNTQKEALWQQRKKLALDDPRGVAILEQIKELEDKIVAITANANDEEIRTMQDDLRMQEGRTLVSLDQKIRAQEILVETLTERYNEKMLENVERSGSIVDTSFDQTQLDRHNKTLDRIEEQIISIRSEQKAPGQIVPLSRAVTRMKQWWAW